MPTRIGIVADDLTGAADTAVAFLDAPMPAVVRFPRSDLERELASIRAGTVAVDAETRAVQAEPAASTVGALTGAFRCAGFDILYKKIDSLLRGHVVPEVRAAMTAWGPSAVALVAPAFPAVGRTTSAGRVVVNGRAQPGIPAIADLFAGSGAVSTIGLDTVRGSDLAAQLRRASTGAGVIVCDAETDADLRAVARAGLVASQPIVWVGSGGLAHALAREVSVAPPADRQPPPRVCGPIVAVVGSLTEISRAQARRLVSEGMTHVRVPPGEVRGMALPRRVDAALDRFEDVLVTIDTTSPVNGEGDAQLVADLGTALAASVRRAVGGLLLTGGDTAAGMLRALECTGLDLVAEIEPGVVLSTTAGSRSWPVITKSGSFGGAATLANAVRYLRGMRD
jgi:4-hydroxythreonine-4-phosphate dehydrogenase